MQFADRGAGAWQKDSRNCEIGSNGGGGGGIRTHETLSGLTVFKTAAFNRSATPPDKFSDHSSLRVNIVTVPCIRKLGMRRVFMVLKRA